MKIKDLKITKKALTKWIGTTLFVFLLIAFSINILVEKHSKTHNLNDYKTIPEGLGVSIHLKNTDERDIQAIADAGFKWVRVDLFWENIEKQKGKYDFEQPGYDELNKWLKDKGIKPYYILDYSNGIYEENRSIVTEEGRKAFSEFVKAATQRYKNQGAIWEIWNEPNTETFWNPQPGHEEYALLVKSAAPIIKEHDPSGIVVAPALAGINENSLTWFKEILDKGILKDIDAISVHPYRSANPEDALNDYKNLKNLIKRYTDRDIPIVSGEWGYSMANTPEKPLTELQQAEYLTRMFLINALQQVPISIWYDWKNDGNDLNNKEHNFGIMWYSSNPKLSYLAMQTLSSTMNGYKFVNRIEITDPSNYILKFENQNGKQIMVFWTTSSSHNMDVSIDSGSGKIISMLGAERTLKWEDEINLNFSSSPNYLIIEEE